MAWLRRETGLVPVPAEAPPDDTPEALRAELASLIRFVNARSSRLPPSAVVTAREITDVLAELVGENATPDIRTRVAVAGIVTDHLPTTLEAFLRAGDTASGSLLESLLDEAISLQDAERGRAADALRTQETFLRTKFSNSDLDL
ncbi:hypothetical protein Amsp01_016620 [Amycolatopsis sp. NBRC 101858]|uniref:hypothetical protein n=1 Tax=Amycolatopsis sp. NBRC 101858 TaxID=3032200 RepID=UPI0024A339A7|nr:hypothetical protein [Amycolatopsis sp. NBRC 101858]GLY35638.1 hypothetical protein Amsp01_016620 [Amycolatopsis sp. NBRC 101858]